MPLVEHAHDYSKHAHDCRCNKDRTSRYASGAHGLGAQAATGGNAGFCGSIARQDGEVDTPNRNAAVEGGISGERRRSKTNPQGNARAARASVANNRAAATAYQGT